MWHSLYLRMISRLEVSRSAANQNSIQTMKQCNFFLTPSHCWNKQSYKKKKKPTMHLLLLSGKKNCHGLFKPHFELFQSSSTLGNTAVGVVVHHRKCTSPSLHALNAIWSSATAKKVLLFVGNISPYLLHDVFLKVFDNLMHYGENQANIRKPTTSNQKPASEPSDYSSYP